MLKPGSKVIMLKVTIGNDIYNSLIGVTPNVEQSGK